jgi:hypothetical protein
MGFDVALRLKFLAQNRISRVLAGSAANHTLGKNQRGKPNSPGLKSLW